MKLPDFIFLLAWLLSYVPIGLIFVGSLMLLKMKKRVDTLLMFTGVLIAALCVVYASARPQNVKEYSLSSDQRDLEKNGLELEEYSGSSEELLDMLESDISVEDVWPSIGAGLGLTLFAVGFLIYAKGQKQRPKEGKQDG